MDEFHLLRPLWLLLLPLVVWAAWRAGLGRGGQDAWRAIVDRGLQPHVLVEAGVSAGRRWPLAIALAAAILASLALAGPAWDRLPVPAYRSDEALVVALDLSRSMDAGDIAPSRLARARLKLLDLLERRAAGQTALVVFTSHAFTVTPLTNDTRTIAALVNALSTDIMPSQGSVIEVGLDKSADLLAQSGAGRGQILVLTDAEASPAAIERARELAAGGVTTLVLAVGSEEGAPIPLPEGGFLTDDRGQVVVPQVDFDSLERLADAGGGRFARLSTDDADLDRLLPAGAAGDIVDTGEGNEREADVWRDQGVWLALGLLPLLALAFRRGFIYVLLPVCLLPMPEAHAFTFRDLWQRRDQQAMEALDRDAPAEAATLFEDPEWSAVANYRAGAFDQSAAVLGGIDAPEALYNRGNALAQAGQLADAVAAYDRVLELEPGHEDATYNREIVAALLDQQQQQEQQQGEQQGQQGQEQEQEAGEGSQSGDPGQNGEAGQDQGESAAADDAEGEGSAGQDPGAAPEPSQAETNAGDGTDGSEESPSGDPTEGEEESGETDGQALAAASAEEVEDWASEQAAEQWLRRIAQDPGGLLRRKFLYQYQQFGIDQDGNRIAPSDGDKPW